MKISPISIVLSVLIIAILGSCASRKKTVYFIDSKDGAIEQSTVRFVPKIEVGDLLSIEVSGSNAELVAPFNQQELVRQGNQITSYENGVPAQFGYLVTTDSSITMPIIGKVKLAGLEREEAVTIIEQKIGELLDQPSVSLRILNFKITVLGEVENPGTFSIPNERITVIEAIGIARDLKITGKRDNILVIRHENNEKKEYRLNLTSKEIFNSPAYYLKQNDVVYVEPNNKARYDGGVLRSAGGVIISATSLIISTMVIIINK